MRRNEQFIQGMFDSPGERSAVERNSKAVKRAVTTISESLSEFGRNGGTVVFDQELHPRDVHALRRHGSGIGNRLGFVVSIPKEGKMITVIEIKERR